jgi:hypothetical protein
MKICSICKRISATEQDHLDCIQKIRVELEEEDFKRNIPEKLELTKDSQNLGIEIKAILDHITKERNKEDST